MKTNERYRGKSGVEYIFEYSDEDSFDSLDYSKCKQVRAVCFFGDKMVIGYGGKPKGEWGLIGGTIKHGETFEETLGREVREESNMKVLSIIPIGYQKMIDTRDGSYVYQLRYACKTRPYGPFVADPVGGITEIKLIRPEEYRKCFDWGEIGERIITRAVKLKSKI